MQASWRRSDRESLSSEREMRPTMLKISFAPEAISSINWWMNVVAHKLVSLDAPQTAAVPLAAITAYEALFYRLGIDRSRLECGMTILIIEGTDGVDSMEIQLAKLAGLTVLATAS